MSPLALSQKATIERIVPFLGQSFRKGDTALEALRRSRPDSFSLEVECPAVRREHTGKNLDQSRFACAPLPRRQTTSPE
jgi:hypothetical protein